MRPLKHMFTDYQELICHHHGTRAISADSQHIHAHSQASHWQAHWQVNQFANELLLARQSAQSHKPRISYLPHFHHNWALFVMVQGQNSLRFSNTKSLSLQAGEVWLVSGTLDDVHESALPIQGAWRALHLDFSPERLARWQAEKLLPAELCPNRGTQLRRLGRYRTSVAQTLFAQNFSNHALSHLALEAAALTLTTQVLQQTIPSRISQRQAAQIDEAVDIIHQNYCQPLSITELAHRVGLNDCYFKRFFKLRTDETPAAMIRRLRLQCAFDGLATRRFTTVNAAMHFVGYHHLGSFQAAFVRQFACTPSQVLRESA